MADIKISELEPTTDLEGLYTIGSDKNNLSKKVSLQFLKDAANYANEQGDYAKQAGDTVNGNVGVSDYPEFSASKSYVIGDIVRYNGVLYAFTANHAASAWNGSDVKATSINAITSGKLTELESEIDDKFIVTLGEERQVINPTWNQGYFISLETNQLRTNSGYQYCDYLDVTSYDEILVSGFFGGINGVTLYDANKSPIKNYWAMAMGIANDNQVIDFPIPISKDAVYVRISTKILATNAITGVRYNVPVKPNVSWVQGMYNSLHNKFNDKAGFQYAQFPTLNVRTIKVSGIFGTWNGVAFFNEGGSPIKAYTSVDMGIVANTQAYDIMLDVPIGSSYCIVSSKTDAQNEIITYATSIKRLYAQDLYEKTQRDNNELLKEVISKEEYLKKSSVIVGEPLLVDLAPIWNKGSYYDIVSLAIKSNSAYQVSDLIDVSQYTRLRVSGFFGAGNGITWHNANGGIMGNVTSAKVGCPVNSQVIDAIIDIPEGVTYMRMSTKIDAVNKIEAYINESAEEIALVMQQGKYFHAGNIHFVSSSEYNSSDYVDVSDYSALLITGAFSTYAGVAFFDETKTCVGTYNSWGLGIPAYTDMTDVFVAVPNGAKYAVISPVATSARWGMRGLKGYSQEVTHQDLDSKIDVGKITNDTYLAIERPSYAELWFDGTLPTDESDARTPTGQIASLRVNGKEIIRFKAQLSIQGHGSAKYAKKGYTLDIFNQRGEELEIKFGNMVATDSFHLKAYATDRTHARDIANGRIWREMINLLDYPYSKVNNNPYTPSLDVNKNELYIADAQYYTDGFPIGVYHNNVFLGLYTLRLKKKRENYALNNKNNNHIFLDSATYTAYLKESFDYADWDVKSPKMSGYEGETKPIPNSDVVAKATRLFDFTKNLSSQYSNHADYIILKHWIAWYIFSEIISNRDTDGNNYNLITWDGQHWSIIPYDLDLTLGLNPWGASYVVDTERNQFDITHDIWSTFRSVYLNDIKSMYAKLRTSGFLTTENLMKYYVDQVKYIPRNIYEADREKWSCIWTNAEPSLAQIELFLNGKLNYLDSQWL